MILVAFIGAAGVAGLFMVGASVAGVQHRASLARAVALAVFFVVMIGGSIVALSQLATNNPHFGLQMSAVGVGAVAATLGVAKKIHATTWRSAAVVVAVPVLAILGVSWALLHNLRITF